MKKFFTFAVLLLVVAVPILLQPSAAQEQEVAEPSVPIMVRHFFPAKLE